MLRHHQVFRCGTFFCLFSEFGVPAGKPRGKRQASAAGSVSGGSPEELGPSETLTLD